MVTILDEIEIVVKPANQLTEQEDRELDELSHLAFSQDHHEEDILWSEANWYIFVKVRGIIRSQVEIIERTGLVNGRLVKLGGIGGVATTPEWQRRGLSSLAMQKAFIYIKDTLGVEFGILICGDHRVSFYKRLGWQVIEGPLFFYQPGGRRKNDGVTMILPCSVAVWPAGEIDLCGLPF